MTRFLLCVWTVLLFAGCISEGGDTDEDTGGIGVGDTLPAFSVQMNDGTTMDNAALRGRISLVMFFNTGCGDCRQELPRIQRIHDTFAADGKVTFLLIGREEDGASVAAYWAANGLTLPYSPQPDRAVYSLFASSGIPRIFLCDTSSRVRYVYTDSPLATEEELAGALSALLSE